MNVFHLLKPRNWAPIHLESPNAAELPRPTWHLNGQMVSYFSLICLGILLLIEQLTIRVGSLLSSLYNSHEFEPDMSPKMGHHTTISLKTAGNRRGTLRFPLAMTAMWTSGISRRPLPERWWTQKYENGPCRSLFNIFVALKVQMGFGKKRIPASRLGSALSLASFANMWILLSENGFSLFSHMRYIVHRRSEMHCHGW